MLNLDWTGIIGLLAIGQSVALMVYVIAQCRTNQLLILPLLLLAILAVALSHDILLHTRLSLYFPHILGLGPLHAYLVGPLLLMISYKLISPAGKLSYLNLLHFLPFVIHIYFQLPTIQLAVDEKIAILERFYGSPQTFSHHLLTFDNLLSNLKFYGHRFSYFIYALYLLNNNKTQILDAVSSRRRFTQLLSLSLIVYCAIWGALRLLIFIPTIAPIIMANSNIINAIGLILSVSLVANFCFSFSIKDIFSGASTRKYQKSNLGDELNHEIYRQITQLLAKPEVFTNPELKLPDLARLSGFSGHQISQAINLNGQTSFNSLLNDIRVEKVKSLFKDSNNHTKDILELAFESGFNSKATFNREFKKRVELTPRQYRSSLK